MAIRKGVLMLDSAHRSHHCVHRRLGRCVRLATLLGQIELTVHVEVVQLGVWHASLLSLFQVICIVVRATLAVGTFFFDDKMLSGVCIDLGNLR